MVISYIKKSADHKFKQILSSNYRREKNPDIIKKNYDLESKYKN